MPLLLEEVVCELEASCGVSPAAVTLTDNPAVHGRERRRAGFDVEEMVAEYGLLRVCLKDLAERHGSSLPEEAKTGQVVTLLEVVRRNVQRLDALVRVVVREESRTDPESPLRLSRREFDLWPLVQGLVHDLRPLAAGGEARLVNGVPENMLVFADAPALSQVFQNLISNALKYAPDGEVTVVARPLDGGGAECWVRDEGAGVPPELIGSVFEKRVADLRGAGRGWGSPSPGRWSRRRAAG
jgi:signal transduction histidine kinase